MQDKRLAILGGEPVRKKKYPKHTTCINDDEKKEILEVLVDGELSGFSGRIGDRFLGGKKVKQLEKNFCSYFKVKHAISFNSATSALHGAIAAAGIGPGDEVITSPFTMSASATAILMNNAIPVFADIDSNTFNIDPDSVKSLLTSRTKGILTVNIFGQPSDLDRLTEIAKSNNLVLIEDNAQSPGAKFNEKFTGTIGHMGILSLNYHKMIQCGEGGIILTDDDKLALHSQLIRNHGEVIIPNMENDTILTNQLGWNYRMTELQAAVAIPQLKKLDHLTKIRIELTDFLTKSLKQFEFLSPPYIRDNCNHVFYVYPIKYNAEKIGISRKLFAKVMKAEGMIIGEGYMMPLYLNPIFQKKLAYTKGCPFSCPYYDGKTNYEKGICPICERMYEKELLTTEICKYPNTKEDILEFITSIKKIVDNIELIKEMDSSKL